MCRPKLSTRILTEGRFAGGIILHPFPNSEYTLYGRPNVGARFAFARGGVHCVFSFIFAPTL